MQSTNLIECSIPDAGIDAPLASIDELDVLIGNAFTPINGGSR